MQGELLAGRYRIGPRLGVGGMGEVWSAQDERMRRDVAVKLVHAAFGAQGTETQDRFRREVQLAARLSHRNVVTAYDWGDVSVGGRQVFYLVMELVQGVSLRRRLEEGRPPWPLAAGWAAQIAQALDEAHCHGVVHRDITPANVLLTPEGTAKILDFGVAKFVGDTLSIHEHTAKGALLGSPPYMSPEQAEDAGQIDHRSDLYSLGCVLYHAVTGRPPFVSASHLGVLRMQAEATPAAPNTLVSELPTALNDLILRLLAKHPDDRPADAAAISDSLATILVNQAVTVAGSDVFDVAQLAQTGSIAERIVAKAWQVWRQTQADCAAKAEEAERLRRQAAEEAERTREQAVEEARRIRAQAEGAARELLAQTRKRSANADRRLPDATHATRSQFTMVEDGYHPQVVQQHVRGLLAEQYRIRSLIRGMERLISTTVSGLADQTDARARTWSRKALQAVEDEAWARSPNVIFPEKTRVGPVKPSFPRTARGYSPEQVHDYLHSLATDQAALEHSVAVLGHVLAEGDSLRNRDDPPPGYDRPGYDPRASSGRPPG
ncbi:protein kinase [Streptomyces sp. NPDC046915]|uniref:serine/threonine-protein kinase n=1 Tax=Streptomyces sp. NPDC046915 TaxID=3155257 RepID=UPI003406FEAB